MGSFRTALSDLQQCYPPTEILVYFIFGSVVLLTGKLAIVGVYPLAAGIALPLLAFGYLVR